MTRFTLFLLIIFQIGGILASDLVWDVGVLNKAPEVFPADEYAQPGVKSIFYAGPIYNGRKTKVFAYMGFPKNVKGKIPAMVLVHGGAGTAIPEWVRLWNKRGYAAIALDTCGAINKDGSHKGVHFSEGGPGGWGSFNQLFYNKTIKSEDLWTWQAVAQIILANSLICSTPNVDAENVGITGISWGGYLTCIAASVDSRFKVAIPVYGCGYLYETPRYREILEKKNILKRWLQTCDPSLYLPDAKMPFLWINGTNDFAFTLNAWKKSYELVKTPSTLSINLRMPHGYGPGWSREEIYAYADHHLKGAKEKIPQVGKVVVMADELKVSYLGEVTPVKAELLYTADNNPDWRKKKWERVPAQIKPEEKTVFAEKPEGAQWLYFDLYGSEMVKASSGLTEIRP